MALPDQVLLSDSFTFLLPYYAIGCAFYFLVEHWNLEVCIYFLTQASFIRRPRATISTEPHFHSCVRADRHCPALRHGTSGRAFCAWAASLIPGMFSTQSVPMHDLMAIARCPVWCSSQQSVRA